MKIQSAISSILFLIAFALVATSPVTARTQDETRDAFVGTVERIDTEAKIIYVKSRDGVVKAFKWTSKTTAHGIKKAAVWTNHEAHVGAHVVIRSLKIAGQENDCGGSLVRRRCGEGSEGHR